MCSEGDKNNETWDYELTFLASNLKINGEHDKTLQLFYHLTDIKKKLPGLNLGKDLERTDTWAWHFLLQKGLTWLQKSGDSKHLNLVYPDYLTQINNPQAFFNRSFVKVRHVGLGP